MNQKKYAINYPVLLACFSLFACGGGSNGSETSNLSPSVSAEESIFLARTVVVPEGARCARGGFQVESGEDKNKDGELEDGEVVREEIICNGQNILQNSYTVPFSKSPEVFADATITCDPLFIEKNFKYGALIVELRACGDIKINGFPFLVRGLTVKDICQTFGFGLPQSMVSTDVRRGNARKFYEWDSSARQWTFVDIPKGETMDGLFSVRSISCLILDQP